MGANSNSKILAEAQYISPVDPTRIHLLTSVQPVRQSWQLRRTTQYVSPVDPTRLILSTSVQPVRLNSQHEKNNAPVKPTKSNPNAGAVVQRDLKMTQRTPVKPTKSNPIAGAVVQRDFKTTQQAPVDPTIKRQKLNAPVYAKTLAPVDPTQ